jgi:phosphohistidine phosphatase SixA
MANIFLFRHGNSISPDCGNERLSTLGIFQAQEAGKVVGEIIHQRDFYLRQNLEVKGDEFKGVLKLHSGVPRTFQFLEKLFESAKERDNAGLLMGYNGLFEINHPGIYNDSATSKIYQIIEQCSPMCGIQFIVGHNPGVANVAKKYVSEGFNFQGDESFLRAASEGSGCYINTLERTVKVIEPIKLNT